MHGYLMKKLPELMDVWTITLTHKDIVKHIWCNHMAYLNVFYCMYEAHIRASLRLQTASLPLYIYLLFYGHYYVVGLKIMLVFIWGNPKKCMHTDHVQRYLVYIHI